MLELSGGGPGGKGSGFGGYIPEGDVWTLALPLSLPPPCAPATHLHAADHRLKHQKIEVKCKPLFQVTSGMLL